MFHNDRPVFHKFYMKKFIPVNSGFSKRLLLWFNTLINLFIFPKRHSYSGDTLIRDSRVISTQTHYVDVIAMTDATHIYIVELEWWIVSIETFTACRPVSFQTRTVYIPTSRSRVSIRARSARLPASRFHFERKAPVYSHIRNNSNHAGSFIHSLFIIDPTVLGLSPFDPMTWQSRYVFFLAALSVYIECFL